MSGKLGFDMETFSADVDRVVHGGLKPWEIVEIDVNATTKNYLDVALPWPCNSIAILSSLDGVDSGSVLTSSTTAQLMVKINNASRGIAFSRIANSGDIQGYSGTVAKIQTRVTVADAGKKIYLLLGLAIGTSAPSGGGSTSGYTPPPGGGGL